MKCGRFLLFKHLFLSWGLTLKVTNFQVFDLGEEAPDKVLRRIYVNLEKLKISGDELAVKIRERLRLIVSWVVLDAFWCICFLYMYLLILQCIICSNLVCGFPLIFLTVISLLGCRWWWNSWLASWSCFWSKIISFTTNSYGSLGNRK